MFGLMEQPLSSSQSQPRHSRLTMKFQCSVEGCCCRSQQRSVCLTGSVPATVGSGEMESAFHGVKLMMVNTGGCAVKQRLCVVYSMVQQMFTGQPCPEFCIAGHSFKCLQQAFFCSDAGTFQFKQIRFEEQRVNASCIQRNGVRGCLEGITLVAFPHGGDSCFQRPSLAGLSVETQAAFIGFKGQIVFPFCFEQRGVLEPIFASRIVLFQRQFNRFDGFRSCPSSLTQARKQRAVGSGVYAHGLKTSNRTFCPVVAQ